jgi:hypothetical protein
MHAYLPSTYATISLLVLALYSAFSMCSPSVRCWVWFGLCVETCCTLVAVVALLIKAGPGALMFKKTKAFFTEK